jgi:hypothetical protein
VGTSNQSSFVSGVIAPLINDAGVMHQREKAALGTSCTLTPWTAVNPPFCWELSATNLTPFVALAP